MYKLQTLYIRSSSIQTFVLVTLSRYIHYQLDPLNNLNVLAVQFPSQTADSILFSIWHDIYIFMKHTSIARSNLHDKSHDGNSHAYTWNPNTTINLQHSQIHSLRQCITHVSTITYGRRCHKFQHVLLLHWQILNYYFFIFFKHRFPLSNRWSPILTRVHIEILVRLHTIVCTITYRKL